MFEALQQLFTRRETELPDSEPKLAVAALLVHLAAIDGTFAGGAGCHGHARSA